MFAPPDTVWACQQDAAGVTGESVAVSPIVQWQDPFGEMRVRVPLGDLGDQTMKRPRDLRHRGAIRGVASTFGADCQVPLADRITRQPREWRRAAAWLRKVADWWDWLADEQEMKQTRPIRRRLIVCAKEEGR